MAEDESDENELEEPLHDDIIKYIASYTDAVRQGSNSSAVKVGPTVWERESYRGQIEGGTLQ